MINMSPLIKNDLRLLTIMRLNARIEILEKEVARLKLKCAIVDSTKGNLVGISGELYLAKLLDARWVGTFIKDYDLITANDETIEVKTATSRRPKFDNFLGRKMDKVYDWLVCMYCSTNNGKVDRRYCVLTYKQVLALGINNCYRFNSIGKYEWSEQQLIEKFGKQ
jgi:hypothetical protein